MNSPIYFSKIQFLEDCRYFKNIILLNIPEKTLSYQRFEKKISGSSIQGIRAEKVTDSKQTYEFIESAVFMKNHKTGFKRHILKESPFEYILTFSYGIELSDKQLKNILPLCNAVDFEQYRNKKMTMGEKGYIGYRDEISVYFSGISDSYLPFIELPMDYYYDEEHIWPSEKLYRYIVKNFLENNKKIKAPVSYGGLSLFF